MMNGMQFTETEIRDIFRSSRSVGNSTRRNTSALLSQMRMVGFDPNSGDLFVLNSSFRMYVTEHDAFRFSSVVSGATVLSRRLFALAGCGRR